MVSSAGTLPILCGQLLADPSLMMSSMSGISLVSAYQTLGECFPMNWHIATSIGVSNHPQTSGMSFGTSEPRCCAHPMLLWNTVC